MRISKLENIPRPGSRLACLFAELKNNQYHACYSTCIVLLRSHRVNSSGTVKTQSFRKIVSILLQHQVSGFKVFNQLISLVLNKPGN